MRVRARPITHTARAGAPCHAVSRNTLPRLHAARALAVAQTQSALSRSAPHTHAIACTHKPRTEELSAVSRNALPRLHAARALAVAQTQPALARSAPHTHAIACTHKPRTEELSIRVQATHRPGAVPMPPARKVSLSTAKDSNKGSSAGASSSCSQRTPQSFGSLKQSVGATWRWTTSLPTVRIPLSKLHQEALGR
jgi:hypothetical protein